MRKNFSPKERIIGCAVFTAGGPRPHSGTRWGIRDGHATYKNPKATSKGVKTAKGKQSFKDPALEKTMQFLSGGDDKSLPEAVTREEEKYKKTIDRLEKRLEEKLGEMAATMKFLSGAEDSLAQGGKPLRPAEIKRAAEKYAKYYNEASAPMAQAAQAKENQTRQKAMALMAWMLSHGLNVTAAIDKMTVGGEFFLEVVDLRKHVAGPARALLYDGEAKDFSYREISREGGRGRQKKEATAPGARVREGRLRHAPY